MKRFVFIMICVALAIALYAWGSSLSTEKQYESDPLPPEEEEVENAAWLSHTTLQGLQFSYPEELGTQYVHAQEWPPLVEQVVNVFSCEEGDITAADGPLKSASLHEIEGKAYCVTLFSEGAAGSTYTTYEYSTQQEERVVRIVFTLRTPQCVNYDEPERTACTAEQRAFNIDELVHQIAASIKAE